MGFSGVPPQGDHPSPGRGQAVWITHIVTQRVSAHRSSSGSVAKCCGIRRLSCNSERNECVVGVHYASSLLSHQGDGDEHRRDRGAHVVNVKGIVSHSLL